MTRLKNKKLGLTVNLKLGIPNLIPNDVPIIRFTMFAVAKDYSYILYLYTIRARRDFLSRFLLIFTFGFVFYLCIQAKEFH